MDKFSLDDHISNQFNKELEAVTAKVLSMGGLVEQQLSNALLALQNKDMKVAESVINTAVEVNHHEVSIDKECIGILARRQPTAGDLRLVITITKTITDLERIGDEAEKIANMAIKLTKRKDTTHNDLEHYVGIKAMGKLVCEMIHDVLDAFARKSAIDAVKIAQEEPKSDEQYGAILRQLITYMMEDPKHITGSIDAIWTARAMERIGDHAKNICEQIIYLVEGKDVRHTNIEKLTKSLVEVQKADESGR